MATVSMKWYQLSMERFVGKVGIVSVSTYRDRYLEELGKNAAHVKRTEGNRRLQGNDLESCPKKTSKRNSNSC